MFDILFQNDAQTFDCKTSRINSNMTPPPPDPRNNTGLCGLENQGSTCYLNSLLQTLLFTPEFREALFGIPENELGNLEDAGSKARIIPLQLQKLFAQLLLTNREAVSTSQLTNSFGWQDQEELQQHDVQELSRILFSAIESSLIGTSGHNLISQLYRGSISSQIICSQCGTSSRKIEDFQDLTVTVSSYKSLQESLSSTFKGKETLSGKNQYFCNKCKAFVNAEKTDKLISLPPIICFSLLRFNYDINQGQRFKETGTFSYPLEIDMQPYCDEEVESNSKYQLFSVIVHSGSCYGGHYYAYIKDIDHFGNWNLIEKSEPEMEEKLDYFNMTNPVTFIMSLLTKHPLRGLHFQSLCSEILKIGISWNEKFKRTFGPLRKFLLKNSNIFSYNKATEFVCLKNGISYYDAESNERLHDFELHQCDHWFIFNDEKICAVHATQMEKQFGGDESAYMLFYRKSSLCRSNDVKRDPTHCIPDRLLKFIIDENVSLAECRELFEISLHTITVIVHYGINYLCRNGALFPRDDRVCSKFVSFDNRETLAELRAHIYQLNPELCGEKEFKLSLARVLPAGLHVYNDFVQDDSRIFDNGIGDSMHLFVWDGLKVDGTEILTGEQWAPILLRILCMTLCGDTTSISHGFPKSITLRKLKETLTEITKLNLPITVSQKSPFAGDLDTEDVFVPIENKDNEMLDSLGFLDNNKLFAKEVLPMLGTEKQVFVHNKTKNSVTVEEYQCPVECFTVEENVKLFTIKEFALEKFSILDDASNYRLRKPSGDHTQKVPLYEHLSAKTVLPEISHLILEEGSAPKEDEITIMLSIGRLSGNCPDYKVNVKKSTTVLQCLRIVVNHCGLEGNYWHLSKSNWMGEAEAPLDKEDLRIEEAGLKHGDLLLLLEGRPPPPGFMSLPIWFSNTPESMQVSMAENNSETIEFRNMYHNLWQKLQEKENVSRSSALYIGEVEISYESTLLHLKRLVITLPKLKDTFVQNFRYLRLRLWNGQPGAVLRNNGALLKKLKISNHQPLCVQLLDHEEQLTENDILLQVQKRIPKSSDYLPVQEICWNTGSSASLTSLRLVLSDATKISDDHLVIAKHYPAEHSWKVITASSSNTKSKQSKKGKINLRQPPFSLKDGDVIGVKDNQFDPEKDDDFRTEDKREIWSNVQSKISSNHFQGKCDSADSNNKNASSPSRPEIGLTIHVDDFT